MSITRAEATEVANCKLRTMGASGVELQLLAGKIEEFDVGWVFFYQSARYIETGDFSDSVVGNAPLFVSRSDGRLFPVSYHRSLAESMAAYRACGNPNAQEIPEVCLCGRREGAQSVLAIQAIRQHSAVGLAHANSAVESCFEDKSPIVSVSSVAEARVLVAVLAEAGFEAQVCYDG